MSEQDNLQDVQRAYDVFAKGDLPALLDLGVEFPSYLWGHSLGGNTLGMDGRES